MRQFLVILAVFVAATYANVIKGELPDISSSATYVTGDKLQDVTSPATYENDDELQDDLSEELQDNYYSAANVTDDELKDITSDIWDADNSSLINMTEYSINSTGQKYFTFVEPNAINSSTFKALQNMLNNYISDIRVKENNTAQHQTEQQQFLEAVLFTGPMQTMWNFLKSKGLASTSVNAFKQELSQYWFTPYSRQGAAGVLGSSGFEHVFVGEIRHTGKDKGVLGFHNWMQFYLEEGKKTLQFIEQLESCEPRASSVNITWQGFSKKPRSSMFIATSPEYDFAIFTLCFVIRNGTHCPTVIDGKPLKVTSSIVLKAAVKTISTVHPLC